MRHTLASDMGANASMATVKRAEKNILLSGNMYAQLLARHPMGL